MGFILNETSDDVAATITAGAFHKAQYTACRKRFIYMNVMRSILLTLVAIFGLIATSCINDDFTDSPSATLTFSTDTLSFGTVFTDLGSPTARLLVYNRNKKGVKISSIKFKDSDTPFTFNVDGVSGSSFRDVEIRGRDSIYIFVECFVNADNSFEPRKVSDRLEFVTNGVTQEIEVEAWAQNVIRLKGMKVDHDMHLAAEMPYVVFDSLTVDRGATLTISPGARILFHDGASMIVNGTLNAVGTVDRIIDFRGYRVDDVLPGISYDVMSGQWGGIRLGSESYNNRIEYVDMRSSSEGLRIDSCGDLTRQKLTLVNSWLHNSSTSVLDSRYAKVDAYGCCFSESPFAVVSLTGGEHNFVQCTIANNYLFSAVTEPNLSLYHCMGSDDGSVSTGDIPYMKANFENCIVWGLGAPLNRVDLTGSDVYLRNVLLKADGNDDDHFVDCIWNEDPLFLTVRNDYYFNYHIQPDSPAIGRGNPDYIIPACLYDMDGYDRLPSSGILPTLGAYANPVQTGNGD